MGNLLGKPEGGANGPAVEAAALPGQTQPEARALLTPEELLAWRPSPADDACRAAVPLPEACDGGPTAPRPRLLACHDMRGGYLEDRLAQGGADADAYTFRHWAAIDAFVYFSHSLATVPPPGWVNAGHRHGVPVLGTLITEWEKGAEYCVRLFGSAAAAEATAAALAAVAAHFGFDGWLINIENAMDMEHIPNLLHFLRTLRDRMRTVCPRGAGVLWYDAVTVEGRLDWQNTLNRLNRPFLDACDAIWINYTWKEGTPAEVQAQAGPRARDVYMGIDCYGRGTYGGGGYCCDVALRAARAAGLSVALFAPGWPYDAPDDPSAAEAAEEQTSSGGAGWRARDERFWACISAAWGPPRAVITSLPAATNFGVGAGRRVLQQGLEVSPCAWYNLSLQGLQPSLGATPSEASGLSMRWTDAAAFDGGSCVAISGQLAALARLTLFRGAAPLPEGGGLAVSFTTAAGPGVRLSLAIQLRYATGPLRTTLLCLPGGPAAGGGSPPPSPTLAVPPVREGAVLFTLLPSREREGRAAGPAEWVTREYSFSAAGCGAARGAEVCAVEVRVQPAEPGAPCRCEAYLGFLSLAGDAGDEPRPPPQPVACLAADDVQLRSGPAAEAGAGPARELSVGLRWGAPAAAAGAGGSCGRYCIWYSFEDDSREGALQYLGTACLPLYQVICLAVPEGAGAVRFAVQAVSGLGAAQRLKDAAQLRLPIPLVEEEG